MTCEISCVSILCLMMSHTFEIGMGISNRNYLPLRCQEMVKNAYYELLWVKLFAETVGPNVVFHK